MTNKLTVGARDGGAAGSAGRLNAEAGAHVDDSGAAGVDSRAALGSLGGSELHRAIVGEADQGATLLKVLNDPLGVVLAQGVPLAGEGVGDALASGQVLDGGSSGGLAGSNNGALDRVSSRYGDAAEVNGRVGVPLVPGIVSGANTRLGPGDTGLEDGGA